MKESKELARLLICTIISLGFTSIMQGCGVIIPGTPWSETSFIGPRLIGNSRAVVVERCAVFENFMSRGPCEIAFVDHNGTKVRWLELRGDIDEYLPKIAPIDPYINSQPFQRSKLPYSLHILTISPIIVLAVPKRNALSDYNYCSVPYHSGCMDSDKTGVTYWYMHEPIISTGSFWFSPTLNISTTFIPDNISSYSIDLKNSRIDMTAKGNVWEVQRNIIVNCDNQNECIQLQPQIRLVPSSDGTEITDTVTGLIWRRCVEGMSWNGTTCEGNACSFTFEKALLHAKAQSDINKIWRVPTIDELSKLGALYFDNKSFPNNKPSRFWSSSSKIFKSDAAWAYGFGGERGPTIVNTKNMASFYLKLVRKE